jgi:hypothetical protein
MKMAWTVFSLFLYSGKYQSYWKPSQTYTATNTYPCTSEESTEAPGSEGKMVPKHFERLPKKRSHARNLSYDNSFQNSLHSGSEMKASRTPSPQTMSTDADMSRGENLAEEKKPPFDHTNLPELNVSPRTNGDELRAWSFSGFLRSTRICICGSIGLTRFPVGLIFSFWDISLTRIFT